ncbi:MAG TPA: VWA domain-containing protein, partial [Vicinamibacteria bacterium]|nr:VWA domain-containing protein [Vicinamibacteria bacterium]
AEAAKPAQAPPATEVPAADTPTFPTQLEQVIVDLVVTDKKGVPIKGLTAADMTVTEDGVKQDVVSFEAVQLPEQPAAAAPPPPKVSSNIAPEEQRARTFVVVFDDMHITPWRANQAKVAVASFLEKGTREGDRVSLISTAGGTWWTSRMEAGRAKLIDMVKSFDGRMIPDMSPERMSDYEAMRIHVYRDPQVVERVLRRYDTYGVTQAMSRSGSDSMRAGTSDDPYVTGRAAEVYFQANTRLRTTLDVMERALNGLAGARGRKSLILVSEGFIHDINVDEFKRVNNAARRANTAIYFVNARGLEGVPVAMTAQFGPALPEQDVGFAFAESFDAVAGSEVAASESGGFTVRNTNDLSSGIQRIANETRVYYLLGYIPTNNARDGKFRKIQVKLAASKGREVRARKGYFAPTESGKSALTAKKGVDPAIQGALDSPWSIDGIPLRMTHFVGDEKSLGKAAVLVTAEVDIRALEFEEAEGRSIGDLQFLLVVAHRASGEFFRYDQGVAMRLQPATRERYSRFWFPITRDFELKSGDYQAKIVVRDTRSKKVGTVIHEFEVPPLGTLRASTPVLSDTQQNPNTVIAEGLPGGRLVALARRDFATGSDLLCQFEVYGAKSDEKSGMPKVVQGYLVRRTDGSILTSMEPSVINPTSLGKVTRLFGFRLTDAAPGDYEILMTIRDELAGQSMEILEPFTVGPPLPATASAQAPAGN